MTLSYAKRYIQPDSEEDDQILADLIHYASGMIRTFTDRLFTTPPVTEQRKIWFSGQRSVRLDDPLANVTEIIAPISHLVDGELYPFEETLAPSSYEVITRATGSVLRLDTPASGRFDVTGEWGWNVIPGDVQYATIATVDEWYRGNQLPAIGGREEGEQESRNIYLPREVQETLIPWTLREYVA